MDGAVLHAHGGHTDACTVLHDQVERKVFHEKLQTEITRPSSLSVNSKQLHTELVLKLERQVCLSEVQSNDRIQQ